MQDGRSASEVARHLEIPLSRASYLLGKLHRGEVAVVERIEARAGRPMKRYRVSPRWFIPFEVTAAENLEAFSSAQIGPRMERIAALAAQQMREYQPVWGCGSLRARPSATWRSATRGDRRVRCSRETNP
jgi:predicted ArsR family transcriptional regulator